ncbi:MAG: hypothetical protein M1816_003926 [Peltula sp. TS41687]|nr:MAG: hypothetical protein M1816_003926 [Peltula sp. TS41687]
MAASNRHETYSMNLRRPGGKKPEWKFTKKTGKLVRDSAGGIDCYRYGRIILTKKLLPFAKECLQERPGTMVQESKLLHMHNLIRAKFTLRSMLDVFFGLEIYQTDKAYLALSQAKDNLDSWASKYPGRSGVTMDPSMGRDGTVTHSGLDRAHSSPYLRVNPTRG